MGFLLGISITLNIMSVIAFLILYKYSLKGVKKNIESFVLNNFCEENIDIRGLYNDN